MTKSAKRKTTTYWINTAIVLFCFFGFGLLPEMFGLNYAGMRAIGIFLGLLWGWIAVEFGWVSILGIIAMGTTGAMSITEAIQDSFLSTTFLQLAFPMILLAYLGKSGFSDWIAYKMLAMNFLKGHPWRIVTMIFVVSSILCLLITPYPMFFLMWSIFMGIADVSGYQKKDKFVGYAMCRIIMMQTIIGSSVPWSFYPVTLQSLMSEHLNGMAFPFVPILLLGIIGQILTIVSYVLIGKFILKLDVSKLQKLPDNFYEKAAQVKLTKEGKLGAGLMIVFILCMAVPSLFPNLPFSPFLSEAGLHGVSIMLLGAFLVLRNKEGKPFASTGELANLGLSWEILFLVTSTLSLATLMGLPDVAILNKVTAALVPVVSQLSPTAFLIVTIMIFWLVTQATHNFVIVLTLVGALAGVCAEMGINPWLFGWLFMCSMNFAYCTPAASSPGAMFYGSEWVAKKDAYICGCLFSFINVILFLLIMMPLANIMFGSI